MRAFSHRPPTSFGARILDFRGTQDAQLGIHKCWRIKGRLESRQQIIFVQNNAQSAPVSLSKDPEQAPADTLWQSPLWDTYRTVRTRIRFFGAGSKFPKNSKNSRNSKKFTSCWVGVGDGAANAVGPLRRIQRYCRVDERISRRMHSLDFPKSDSSGL